MTTYFTGIPHVTRYPQFGSLQEYFEEYADTTDTPIGVAHLGGLRIGHDLSNITLRDYYLGTVDPETDIHDDLVKVLLYGSVTAAHDTYYGPPSPDLITSPEGYDLMDYESNMYTDTDPIPDGTDWQEILLAELPSPMGWYSEEHKLIVIAADFRYLPHEDDVDAAAGWQYHWDAVFTAPLDELCGAGLSDEERAARQLERFMSIARQRTSAELTTIRQRIRDNEARVTTSVRTVSEATSKLDEDKEILAAVLDRRNAGSDDQFRTEFDKIIQHADVESVKLSGQVLRARTSPITMVDPTGDRGSTVVGAFEITLNFAGNYVTASNLTNAVDGRDHPHISGGEFCLGELSSTMSRLMRERHIAAALNLAIESLKTFNPEDDWGRFASLWFEGVHPDERRDEDEE